MLQFLPHSSALAKTPPRVSSHSPQEQALQAKVLFEHGLSLYQQHRYNAAIAAFEAAKQLTTYPPELPFYLARAYVYQGNLYGNQGSFERQRQHYRMALDLDPRLLEDGQFVQKYRQLQAYASRSIRERRAPSTLPPFKQRAFSFGLGLTLGIEGLLGIQLGALFWGIVNPLVTFSPVLQSLDVTLRIIPLRRYAWSPSVSFGVAIPVTFDNNSRLLSSPAPIIHANIGVHYIAPIGLAFAAGLSFTYNFTPGIEAPFLPIPSVQLAWHF